MKNNKYGIISLRKQFPTDKACIEFLFYAQHTHECQCGGTFSLMRNGTRKVRTFQCSKCRAKISPTKDTIFHKSDTPLTLWFHAIMVFSNAKSGISAKTIERDLEVTYKTAWRMLTVIRRALKQSTEPLTGDVEVDGGYFGGRGHAGKDNVRLGAVMRKKALVFAAAQRGGTIRADIMKDGSARSHGDFIKKHVSQAGTRLMTDGANHYKNAAVGYDRHFVEHTHGEYVRGDVHVNNVETFWAHVKRSIRGTHKSVSNGHLQEYLDGFVWHYNQRRDSDAERFSALLGMLLQPVK
jgi:transposase